MLLNELLIAVASALAAGFLLRPIVKRLPADMARNWYREAEEEVANGAPDMNAARFQFGTVPTAVFVIAAAALGFLAVRLHGMGEPGAAWTFYFLALLLLAAINLKHALLPDSIVLGTLWVGLLYHAYTGAAADHLYGAAAAYAVSYGLTWVLAATTKRWVFGQGDFKTLAMAGAWLGLSAVPGLLVSFLIVSVVAAFVVAIMAKRAGGRRPTYVPTGTAHVAASLLMACGPHLRRLVE